MPLIEDPYGRLRNASGRTYYSHLHVQAPEIVSRLCTRGTCIRAIFYVPQRVRRSYYLHSSTPTRYYDWKERRGGGVCKRGSRWVRMSRLSERATMEYSVSVYSLAFHAVVTGELARSHIRFEMLRNYLTHVGHVKACAANKVTRPSTKLHCTAGHARANAPYVIRDDGSFNLYARSIVFLDTLRVAFVTDNSRWACRSRCPVHS